MEGAQRLVAGLTRPLSRLAKVSEPKPSRHGEAEDYQRVGGEARSCVLSLDSGA
jgi:hypothetical protein